MAFTNTPTIYKQVGYGYVMERGTFNANGVTEGTITAATQSSGSPTMPVYEIKTWSFTNDNNNLVIPSVSGVNANQIKITVTSGDTGTYTIIGKAK